MSKFIVLHRRADGKEAILNTDLVRFVISEKISSRKKGEPAIIATNVTTMGGSFSVSESYEEVKKMLMGDENDALNRR